jgi:hypothetical protein
MLFPIREAEIIALAYKIIAGMTENPDFPSPPVSPSELRNQLEVLISRSDAQVATHAAAKQATEAKQSALNEIIFSMKAMLRYAETMVRGNGAKLSMLGWGARREATTHLLEIPGQPRALEARYHGEGWLILDWKKPADGGEPACYKIERRGPTESGSTWTIAGISTDIEVRLNNQERGKEWEYRVLAENKTGESLPSNVVVAVL